MLRTSGVYLLCELGTEMWYRSVNSRYLITSPNEDSGNHRQWSDTENTCVSQLRATCQPVITDLYCVISNYLRTCHNNSTHFLNTSWFIDQRRWPIGLIFYFLFVCSTFLVSPIPDARISLTGPLNFYHISMLRHNNNILLLININWRHQKDIFYIIRLDIQFSPTVVLWPYNN